MPPPRLCFSALMKANGFEILIKGSERQLVLFYDTMLSAGMFSRCKWPQLAVKNALVCEYKQQT